MGGKQPVRVSGVMSALMAAATFRIGRIMECGLNAVEDHAYAGPSAGLDVEMTPCMALEDLWI
jgi:hypothetical protein